MKYEDLKKYVYFALQTETRKYQLEQCIKVIQEKKEKLCIPRYIPILQKKEREKIDIESVGVILVVSFILVAVFATWLNNYIEVTFLAVLTFTFLLCGVFLAVIYYSSCKKRDRINNEIEQKYNNEKAKELERLQKEHLEKEKLEQFIDKLSIMTEEINRILFEIYSPNIIHPSYRGIIAMSVIYQLLDTKICYELEGVDGAYNVCNTEQYRRQMLIKVDAILENVENIRYNQYALFEMLKNTKNILEGILLCEYIENIQINKISNDINVIKFFEEIEYIKNYKDSLIKEICDILNEDINKIL